MLVIVVIALNISNLFVGVICFGFDKAQEAVSNEEKEAEQAYQRELIMHAMKLDDVQGSGLDIELVEEDESGAPSSPFSPTSSTIESPQSGPGQASAGGSGTGAGKGKRTSKREKGEKKVAKATKADQKGSKGIKRNSNESQIT